MQNRNGIVLPTLEHCTISGSDHVVVTNTLEINGTINQHLTTIDKNTELVTITAATNKRHFYINNGKIILRHIKLVGGDVSSYGSSPDYRGGSILIWTNGGEINLYSSIVFNNTAIGGGGIYPRGASSTNQNAIMNIYNSIIQNNEATYGGGIYIQYAVCTIDNTTIDNNQASSSGGGMLILDSDVTMKNTIISNNNANEGGGLFIEGDSTTVTLRESTFKKNVGNVIYTSQSPTISLINTYFNNTNNNNNIYVDSDGTPTWKTCSNNLCTESPFTGTCSQVDNTDIKLGVICKSISTCSRSDVFGSVHAFGSMVTLGVDAGTCFLEPGEACRTSVLIGCTADPEDKAAIIAAYKQLNQCT